MNILDFIMNRRSIRRYTGEKVSVEMLHDLLKAAMYAPSAVNKQPWHFILVQDAATLSDLSGLHPYASMLPKASAAIVVCGDENLANTPAYWPVDCAAATENILLAAHGLGLGAVWLGVYPRPERINALAEYFHLPVNIHPFSMVSVGYPAEQKTRPERFKPERIHYEKWGV